LAARGESQRYHSASLLTLLDDYGPEELAAAIERALERDALGAGAIAHILETRRRQRGLKPPIPIVLPDRPGVRDLDVRRTAWRPTMSSLDPIPTTLRDQLRQLGLLHTATDLEDFIARATRKLWSPIVQLERLAEAELAARLRQRVERRLKDARLGRFNMMADFEWAWPTHIHRQTVERVLALDFLTQRENVIVVASHGLGKTMIAKNLVHQAILAGHSARFLTAADLILDLTKQETARALQHRLRTYMRPALLAIDEVGYLSYDAHAADLLFQGRQPPLRTEVLGHHHELAFQTMGHRLPERGVCRRPHRPTDTPRRDRHHRGRVVSEARSRAGPEAEAGAEAEALITADLSSACHCGGVRGDRGRAGDMRKCIAE
jgi:DNA replication protein DnaC